MQIVNHGVQNELMQNMRNVAYEFFKLPIKEKDKYAMLSNDIHGYGHAYVVSEDQTLDWTDTLFLLIYPNRFRKLQFWPRTPLEFKYTIFTISISNSICTCCDFDRIHVVMQGDNGGLFE